MQGNNISALSELQETLSGMKKRYGITNSEIKQTVKLLHERKELIDQAEKYLQYRDYHKTYKQTKPKKQEDYAERSRTELALYGQAERYLKEEVAESETVKRCVEQAIPPTEQRKEKSKTHDESL